MNGEAIFWLIVLSVLVAALVGLFLSCNTPRERANRRWNREYDRRTVEYIDYGYCPYDAEKLARQDLATEADERRKILDQVL